MSRKTEGQLARTVWDAWQLAPDSDPAMRYILTSPDGEVEHPLNLKFSSAAEARNFLTNNPQYGRTLPEQRRDSQSRRYLGTVDVPQRKATKKA
jgi:hypothetical protein